MAATIRRHRFVTDHNTLALLEDCKQETRIHAYLAVVETERVTSPALFGIIRPRLLLPAGTLAELGPEQLRHVFLHELAHLQRHDIAVNWVMTLLQALHWFNPWSGMRLRGCAPTGNWRATPSPCLMRVRTSHARTAAHSSTCLRNTPSLAACRVLPACWRNRTT